MKGWTVKTQATKNGAKGIAAREYYLHNKNDPSHAKTEAIVQIWGKDGTMAGIVYNAEKRAAQVKAEGKGGRPTESYAMEFTLDLPKGYRPTNKQWQEIAKQMIIDVSKKLGIPPKTLSEQTYAVVHQQDQEIEYDSRGRKIGTGDHMHVVMGKFTPDGVCLRDLQRKTITRVVKESFNNSTMKIGFDWTQYRDHKLQAQENANKRTVPTWQIRAARQKEALDKRQEALDEQELQLMTEKEDLLLTKRLMKRFEAQGMKWLEAHKNQDVKQMKKQANRLNKSLLALDALGLLSSDQQTLEGVQIISQIHLIMDQINQKEPETLTPPSRFRP